MTNPHSHPIKVRALILAPLLIIASARAYAQTDPQDNTFVGTGALLTVEGNLGDGPTAFDNSAFGYNALLMDATGNGNTAVGSGALFSDTADQNTATGYQALYFNSTGHNNVAAGWQALVGNTTGLYNTALGSSALGLNSTASNNSAVGYGALYHNNGSFNTASGGQTLNANSTGSYNTASGYEALLDNTTGQQNSASGVYALHDNTTGSYNTASGVDALYSNTTGSSNIAEGYKAGFKLTTGSNNIDIGNQGEAGESGTIRIGTKSTHTMTYVAGIYGTSVSGNAVMVSSTGQLGVTVSSERFKTAIAPMGSYTTKLSQLRPVTFHLKTDPGGALQAGLIAEEVAKVYPELVIRDEKGRIDGVRYDELAPMLLNEMQQQQRRNEAQAAKNIEQGAEIRALKSQMAELAEINQTIQVALRELLAREEFVVQH